MKKAVIRSAMFIGLIMLCFLIYIKLNQPLVDGTVAFDNEKHIVVVGVGNKGFQEIKITDVLINNNEQPQKLKVQVSNPLKGFALTDSFEAVAGEYGIKNLESVTIQPKTSPQMQYEKMDKGTATEKDVSYGISIVSDRPIETVIIQYQYLGLPFVKTISIH
ncbi:hypothetical protein ACIQD3_01995 [Peribacillus loiseleuriae]|uniref:hypothetical protein n=1 Tax=Peribacillus loiseleuriae TaxID=1679170 RepID=UPI0038052295